MATATTDYIAESESLDWANEATVEESGVCRNIALCGNRSLNGYDIPPSAFRSEARVKELYEGRSVFVNHQPPEKRNRPFDRSLEDLAGVIENVTFRNGRPYGDVVTDGYPKGDRLQKAVKAKLRNVGMSHVAAYQFNSDRSSVESVEEVATVDLVVHPATTKTMSEQRDSSMADDKLVANLESQIGELRNTESTLKQQVADEKRKATEAESKLTELQGKYDTLKAEHGELQAKVDSFESAKALSDRRASIESALKKAELNIDDKVQVSESFMDTLMGVEDAGKRDELIKDRAQLVKSAGKGSGGAQSRERRAEGTTHKVEDDWDAYESRTANTI